MFNFTQFTNFITSTIDFIIYPIFIPSRSNFNLVSDLNIVYDFNIVSHFILPSGIIIFSMMLFVVFVLFIVKMCEFLYFIFHVPNQRKQTKLEKIYQQLEELTECELVNVLEDCASRVLIPNWYTKSNLERLTNTIITDCMWNEIMNDVRLFDNADTMCINWFENNYKHHSNNS
jgi:hypothetical protein